MAASSINCLAIVLKELGWSYTRLIAELRRQAEAAEQLLAERRAGDQNQ